MAIETYHRDLRLIWEENDEFVLSLDPLQGYWTEEQYYSGPQNLAHPQVS